MSRWIHTLLCCLKVHMILKLQLCVCLELQCHVDRKHDRLRTRSWELCITWFTTKQRCTGNVTQRTNKGYEWFSPLNWSTGTESPHWTMKSTTARKTHFQGVHRQYIHKSDSSFKVVPCDCSQVHFSLLWLSNGRKLFMVTPQQHHTAYNYVLFIILFVLFKQCLWKWPNLLKYTPEHDAVSDQRSIIIVSMLFGRLV